MPQVSSEIRTFIDELTGEPRVVIAVYEIESGNTVLPISLTPTEARQTSQYLIMAAEAIEQDAHTIAVLRSLKFEERHIAQAVKGIRERRGSDINSLTLPESHEEGDTD